MSFSAPRASSPPPALAPNAPSVALIRGFLTPKEALDHFAQLREELDFRPDELLIAGRQVRAKREVDYRGDPEASYAYSGALKIPAPWTPTLASLRDRAALAANASFNACLCNWYESGGAGMGWHADDEPELGPEPVIASLSLGQTRLFRFRLKQPWRDAGDPRQTWDFQLASGDLLIMSGATQRFFQHALPETVKAPEARLNLTFRRLFSRSR